jgi:hypothetical protein
MNQTVKMKVKLKSNQFGNEVYQLPMRNSCIVNDAMINNAAVQQWNNKRK